MTEKKPEKHSFVIYESFFDAAENMDDKQKVECLWKIKDYALYGKDEKSDNWGVNLIMNVAKPLLDAANKRYDKKRTKNNKNKDNKDLPNG